MGCIKFFLKFLCYCLCAENFIGETIDETAQGSCNSEGLFIANGEINLSAVHGVVPVYPAEFCQSAQSGRKTQALNLFCKGIALPASLFCYAFKTGAKQCTGSTWRKANDGLGFTKYLRSGLGHVLGRGCSAFDWINNVLTNFKNIFIATDALPNAERERGGSGFYMVSEKEKTACLAMWTNH